MFLCEVPKEKENITRESKTDEVIYNFNKSNFSNFKIFNELLVEQLKLKGEQTSFDQVLIRNNYNFNLAVYFNELTTLKFSVEECQRLIKMNFFTNSFDFDAFKVSHCISLKTMDFSSCNVIIGNEIIISDCPKVNEIILPKEKISKTFDIDKIEVENCPLLGPIEGYKCITDDKNSMPLKRTYVKENN